MLRAWEQSFRGAKPLFDNFWVHGRVRFCYLLSINTFPERWIGGSLVWRLLSNRQCGNTCWANVTHNNLQMFGRLIGKQYDESFDQLVSCDHRCNYKQRGGQPMYAMQHCMMKGVFSPTDEIDYFPSFGEKMPLSGYIKLHPTEDYLIRATAQQPVIVCMRVGKDFREYSGGIFQGDSAPTGGHCVNCVGYEDDFFLLQNTWGDGWGENGYMKIAKAGVNNMFRCCYIPYVQVFTKI